ncbi:MAG: hypothetical protein KC438_03635 [Thermomicrobiales bacterium]|nr:hypothetical protein [Thermomicrobiales bacterium]MCO5222786.1 hypothetical protein [Thermomicrobiales bacterium]
MTSFEPDDAAQLDSGMDRRTLIKGAAGATAALGLRTAISDRSAAAPLPFVPSDFRAVIHVTRADDLPYAFSALQTIADHYSKASGRLVLDGSAVTSLTSDQTLDALQQAHEHGAEIVAASDALEINGVDVSSLPDFVNTKETGLIAVVDAQLKGFHYYKL